jgi:hypothetical protein
LTRAGFLPPYGFTAVLAMFDESAARWIEDAVPDSWRALRLAVTSDDDAAAKIVQGLADNGFSAADKRAMVSAFLCRAYNVAAAIEADPAVALPVRVLIKNGRTEGW